MLLFIFIWVYIFFLAITQGFFLLQVLDKFFNPEKRYQKTGLVHTLLAGVLCMTVVLSYWSIFEKIGILTNIVLFIVSFLIYWGNKDHFRNYLMTIKNTLPKPYFLIALALTLFYVLPDFSDLSDLGTYHAQAIQWINEYPVVKGLGNLHGRLAFNSHIFLTNALFDLQYLRLYINQGQLLVFYPLNSFLMLLLLTYLFRKIAKSFQQKNITQLVFYFFIFLTFRSYKLHHTASTSSDTPYDVYLLFFIFYYWEVGKEKITFNHITILFLLFLPTIKVSALPVFAFMAFLFFIAKESWKQKLIFITIFTLIFYLPFFYRHYISSGYLLYPLASIDIFNPDWKIPFEQVNEIQGLIRTHAWLNEYANKSLFSIISDPYSYWKWFSYNGYFWKLIVVLNLLLAAYFIGKFKKKWTFEEKIIIAFTTFNILFCFLTAPQIRFMGIPLALNAAFFLSRSEWLLRLLNAFIYRPRFGIIVLPLTLLFILPLNELNLFSKNLPYNLILPSPIQKAEVISVGRVKRTQQDFFDAFCFNCSIPCTSTIYDNLELRDSSDLGQGFRIKETKKE